MKKIVLMAGAIGLLFVGFIGAGCTTAIFAYQYAVGLDGPVSSAFPLGSSRQEVETKLGKPATSRALPDGGRVDTYEYTTRPTKWPGNTTAGVWAVINVITLGGGEMAEFPKAIQEFWKNRHTATFTYNPNDRLLEYGPPPPYGPPDASLGSLSMKEIRERCRSEALGDPRDFECVVRRLAIWGIE